MIFTLFKIVCLRKLEENSCEIFFNCALGVIEVATTFLLENFYDVIKLKFLLCNSLLLLTSKMALRQKIKVIRPVVIIEWNLSYDKIFLINIRKIIKVKLQLKKIEIRTDFLPFLQILIFYFPGNCVQRNQE